MRGRGLLFSFITTVLYFSVSCSCLSLSRGLRPRLAPSQSKTKDLSSQDQNIAKVKIAAALIASISYFISPASSIARDDLGANDTSNTKILKGGASTLQQGISKTITRGVNLDGSDFGGKNLKGVAFQQSIVRDANMKGTNLVSASFFDATLDGTTFEDSDLTLANLEMAQFPRCNFKNAVLREMYVVGATSFENVATIENSDWTDTQLSKYQQKYLCGLASAKGTNPKTGVDTRESLMCQD